jgi:hypothetical protein
MAPKKEGPAAMSCCCMNMKMQGNQAADKAQDLNALVEQMKTAKSDQLLDAMAAVIKKLIEERQAGETKEPEAAHHH